MTLFWRLVLAFYLPLHFAVGCFYVASLILGGKVDCRNLCTIPMGSCADSTTLILFDLFAYPGIGLFFLAFILPFIIYKRHRPVYQTKFLS
jgi:hypothetical protein